MGTLEQRQKESSYHLLPLPQRTHGHLRVIRKSIRQRWIRYDRLRFRQLRTVLRPQKRLSGLIRGSCLNSWTIHNQNQNEVPAWQDFPVRDEPGRSGSLQHIAQKPSNCQRVCFSESFDSRESPALSSPQEDDIPSLFSHALQAIDEADRQEWVQIRSLPLF